jgi:hypothetical protein
MKKSKLVRMTMLAAVMGCTGFLMGCADGGGDGDDLLILVSGGPNGGNCESDNSVLDGAQCTVTVLVDDLADIFAGTPLEPFIQCIDPLANNLVDGPDSVLNTLLVALAEQNPDPAAFQNAVQDLADALASLGTNLPNALLALSGDDAAIEACVNGTGGGTGGGSPLDPNQLSPLCALPTIGPALVGGIGGTCP